MLLPQDIRSLAFLGHAGTGKTTLIEMLLALGGAIEHPGSIDEGTTVCDYDKLEKLHRHSAKLATAYFDRENVRVQLIDTPGFPDFVGQALAALDAAETVVTVINPQNGIEIGASRAMLWGQTRKLCRVIVINRIDCVSSENLSSLVTELQASFGQECLPINLPAAKSTKIVDCFLPVDSEASSDFGNVEEAHRAIVEQIVEVDEALTDRYLNGEPLSQPELRSAFHAALREGHLIPILFTSASSGVGLQNFLNFVISLAPSPLEGNFPLFEIWPHGDEGKASNFVPTYGLADHVIAHVFKIEVDSYMGKIATARVLQGTIVPDCTLYSGNSTKPFRISHIFSVQGKQLIPTLGVGPGAICAFSKVEEIAFDAVLHDAPSDNSIHFRPLPIPYAVYGVAVRARLRSDEQKIAEILHRLAQEDPGLHIENDPISHEVVIMGLGELHLGRVLERISSQYKIEIDSHPPTIPFRETITCSAEGHHRHKKQTGGAGQFGEVYLRIAPLVRGAGFRFRNEVKGGVIPSSFIPAVEKGVRDALSAGAIAGFPLQDIEVTVFDGKTHPVDGKEVAFIAAGRKAFIEAVKKGKPVILEPYVKLEVFIPDRTFGDVSGEISARRGQITSSTVGRAGMVIINAKAPLAELSNFQRRLKSVTGGQGSYTLELLGYEVAPENLQSQLITAFQPHEDI